MARPGSSPADGSLLRNHSKLHGPWPPPKVISPNPRVDALTTRSICQQICYTDMLPFEDIPDDTVPVTAYLKELLRLATPARPLLIFLDSVDELTGSQVSQQIFH